MRKNKKVIVILLILIVVLGLSFKLSVVLIFQNGENGNSYYKSVRSDIFIKHEDCLDVISKMKFKE